MPAILTDVYDPFDKDINQLGDKELSQRAKDMQHMWRYYDGDHLPPLKRLPNNKRDDNVITNHFGKAADRANEFIGVPTRFEVRGVGGELEPDPDTGELVVVVDDAQSEVDTLYDQHKDMIPELVLSGLVTGHTFLKLYEDDETGPTMDLVDPMYMLVFTDARQPRTVLWYRMQWKQGDQLYRQDIVPVGLLPDAFLAGRPEEAGWAILDYAGKDGGQLAQKGGDWWLFDFPPIVQWRNKRRPHTFYGVGEFDGLDKLNDTINFIDSNTARIIKFHAHPRTIGKGVDAKSVESTSIDGFFTIPDGEVYNLEMQSDLSSSMNYLLQKKADFYSKARVVDLSTIKDQLGKITNFGVRMMFSEMLAMGEEKRRYIGQGVGEALRRLTWMRGVEMADPPLAQWADPLPINRLEVLSAAEIEARLKTTSKQTLTKDLGRDYLTERERMAEEKQTAGDVLAEVLETAGETGTFGG